METGAVVDDRFEVRELAGRGGMGAVYRALDRQTGRTVALKLMVGAAAQLERFRGEAAVLSELAHPRIVRYVAHGRGPVVGQRGESLYLAMEWLEGEDLSERLRRGGLDVEESVALGRHLAGALAQAHARAIVHRDIKPSNVFLPEGAVERAKLLDFGIARRMHDARRDTGTGWAIGTPGYMAPEQARGQPDVDARADVFALGCLLFECLAGRPAFVANGAMAILAKILLEDAPRLSDHLEGAPPALDELIGRMLAKDRDERPASARFVAAELEELGPVVGARRRAPSAAPSLTGGELRVCCVLLASIADLDTEADSAPTMARAESPIFASAVRFGGLVEVLADGTVVASFGRQATPADQAFAAARCGLALSELPSVGAIALATGRGEAGRAPVGEAIDRATQLLREARPREEGGQRARVRVDASTRALLEPRFELEPQAGAFTLLRPREDDEATRSLVGKPTPFVGRDREVAALEAILDESIEESLPRVVLITSAPGVGKSRLRSELLRRLARRSEPITVWRGRGDPIGQGSPFGVVGPLLRRAMGISDGAPLAVRRAALDGYLRRLPLGTSAGCVGDYLGELVGAPSAAPSPALVEARANAMTMGDELRRAWEDLIAAECARRPLLLVLEDLHWGDAPSIVLVDQVLRNLVGSPLMVLALARPEVLQRFPRLWAGRELVHVALPALSPRAGAQLARAVLGPEVPEPTITSLVARADGNAFFLEELIRAAAEGKGELPDSVLGTVSGRLLELEPEARRVLRAASVFGQTFWTGGLEALLGGRDERARLEPWLEVLAAEELVSACSVSRFPGQIEWEFRHALVRDAAYAMLTPADRALGHRLAAEWLEPAGEHDPMILAEHSERGGELARAARWYQQAAELALEGHDFTGAIERAARAEASGADASTLPALWRIQTSAHAWRGDNQAAIVLAEQSMAALPAGSPGWLEAAGQAAVSSGKLGRNDRVTELVRALSAHLRDGVASAPLVVALAASATQLDYAGLAPEAAALLSELVARASAELGSDASTWSHVDLALAMHELCAGDLESAAAHTSRAHASHASSGNRRAACLSLSNWAYMRAELGELDAAEPMFREALEGCRRMGLDSVLPGVQANLGWLLSALDRLEEAEALARAAVQGYEAQGHARMEGAARIYLGRTLAARGELERRGARAARRRLRARRGAAPPDLRPGRAREGAPRPGSGRRGVRRGLGGPLDTRRPRLHRRRRGVRAADPRRVRDGLGRRGGCASQPGRGGGAAGGARGEASVAGAARELPPQRPRQPPDAGAVEAVARGGRSRR